MAYSEISRGGATQQAVRGRRNPKGRKRHASHRFVARRRRVSNTPSSSLRALLASRGVAATTVVGIGSCDLVQERPRAFRRKRPLPHRQGQASPRLPRLRGRRRRSPKRIPQAQESRRSRFALLGCRCPAGRDWGAVKVSPFALFPPFALFALAAGGRASSRTGAGMKSDGLQLLPAPPIKIRPKSDTMAGQHLQSSPAPFIRGASSGCTVLLQASVRRTADRLQAGFFPPVSSLVFGFPPAFSLQSSAPKRPNGRLFRLTCQLAHL
jgi:hypothetical protein